MKMGERDLFIYVYEFQFQSLFAWLKVECDGMHLYVSVWET